MGHEAQIMKGMVEVAVKLEGLSPLIVNRADPKVIDGSVTLKDLTPEEQAGYCLYTDDDGNPSFPSQNINRSLYEAAIGEKTPGKGSMGLSRFIPLVRFPSMQIPLKGEDGKVAEAEIFTTTVNVGKGSTILRHRPMFKDWSLSFNLTIATAFFADLPEAKILEIVNRLFDIVGIRIGFGDWRPAKKGIYGTFAVTQFEKV